MSTAATEPNLRSNSRYRRAPRIAPTAFAVATAFVLATGGEAMAMQQEAPACVAGGVPFRTAIAEVHELQSNVGYAAAVMLDGQLVESVVGGMADLEHQVPVKPESVFGIASITKAFTGAAFMRLYEAGSIELDAPVQQYVPEFPERDQGVITVRHLLTHTSGLPHPQSVRTPHLYATHYDDVIDALEVFLDVRLLYEPGTGNRYSSSNYNLLAAVIQRAAGIRFQDFVAETIFEPLDLTIQPSTTYVGSCPTGRGGTPTSTRGAIPAPKDCTAFRSAGTTASTRAAATSSPPRKTW